MHIFKARTPTYNDLFGVFLQPDKWYLAETQNATPAFMGQPSAIEARYPGVELKPLKWEEMGFRTVPRYDNPKERVWVIRAGGYGDLFYLLPVLKVIASKLECPAEQLILQTAMEPFATTIPLQFRKFPSALDEIDKDAAILNMEDIPGELEYEGAGSTAVRYARRAGLTEDDLDFDGLFPKELQERGERLWREWYGNKRPRVVIALTASAATRSVPAALQVALAIYQRAAIYFASNFAHPLPFPYSLKLKSDDWIGLVMAADAVIGADTAPTHLAILLRKPTLAVFGAIPSKLRIPECLADNVKVIDVDKTSTCPCKLNRPFCPVTQQAICFALASKTREIIEIAMEFLSEIY